MDKRAGGEARPQAADAERTEPTMSSQAAVPSPPSHAPQPQGDVPGSGDGGLQDVMPEIVRLAQKVGGFKRLAQLATELDQAGGAE